MLVAIGSSWKNMTSHTWKGRKIWYNGWKNEEIEPIDCVKSKVKWTDSVATTNNKLLVETRGNGVQIVFP